MATQAVPSIPLHKLDTAIYNRMVASGALEDEPVELLDGWLVDAMSPQSPAHAAAIRLLTRHLSSAQAWLQVQLPLEIPPDSEPEPDLALVDSETPPDRHPRTASLVVEIAMSSQAIDRGVKARLYAKADVPTYWLVDVPAKVVEVYTDPGPTDSSQTDSGQECYRSCKAYGLGDAVPSPAEGVPDLDVGGLFEGITD